MGDGVPRDQGLCRAGEDPHETQESQEMRRAFLAERAYNSRSGGQWGSGLSDLAMESLIDAVGYHLVPMYRVIRQPQQWHCWCCSWWAS